MGTFLVRCPTTRIEFVCIVRHIGDLNREVYSPPPTQGYSFRLNVVRPGKQHLAALFAFWTVDLEMIL